MRSLCGDEFIVWAKTIRWQLPEPFCISFVLTANWWPDDAVRAKFSTEILNIPTTSYKCSDWDFIRYI